MTQELNIVLCVAILTSHIDGQQKMLTHCGWRCAYLKIPTKLWKFSTVKHMSYFLTIMSLQWFPSQVVRLLTGTLGLTLPSVSLPVQEILWNSCFQFLYCCWTSGRKSWQILNHHNFYGFQSGMPIISYSQEGLLYFVYSWIMSLGWNSCHCGWMLLVLSFCSSTTQIQTL